MQRQFGEQGHARGARPTTPRLNLASIGQTLRTHLSGVALSGCAWGGCDVVTSATIAR